jgi:hypothetical protein
MRWRQPNSDTNTNSDSNSNTNSDTYANSDAAARSKCAKQFSRECRVYDAGESVVDG